LRLDVAGFRRDERAATAVEFGFIAPPFFLFMYAIIEIALVFFAGQLLETGVARASRAIRTGEAQSWSRSDFIAALCGEIPALVRCSEGNGDLLVDVRVYPDLASVSPTRPVDSNGDYNITPSYQPGVASDIVVVSVFYKYRALTSFAALRSNDLPDGSYLMAGVAAFRNEPF